MEAKQVDGMVMAVMLGTLVVGVGGSIWATSAQEPEDVPGASVPEVDDSAASTAREAARIAEQAAAEAAQTTNSATASEPELPEADKGRVCRAVIASLFGRDPSIIRVVRSDGDLHRVRYMRSDGTIWTNECRVGASTVLWRAYDAGGPGRWRIEDNIRFRIDGPTIRIQTFMRGELVTSDAFEVK